VENPARIPDSEGIPLSIFDDVILAPWNDVAALERILTEHGRELAAVITEPIMANMGCILPREGYLQRLRELTRECGALLILDEVVTGFRYAPGDARNISASSRTLARSERRWARDFPWARSPDHVRFLIACSGATRWFCTMELLTDIG